MNASKTNWPIGHCHSGRTPTKGALKDQQLQVIENAGIMIQKIESNFAVGKYNTLLKFNSDQKNQENSNQWANGSLASWIDCHTALLFCLEVEPQDFAMREFWKNHIRK